jgi:D-arabinose 1-dehydrogenase-like Zn-dependent alcohol dehydrogenase
MAEIIIKNPYEAIGARAPIPCDISEAHGVAQAVLTPGTTLTPLPFRHPDLLDSELRIKVTHAGMCHTDTSFANLKWGNSGFFPLVPGHEIVGVVDKKGEGVEDFRIGERVGFGVFRSCCSSCAECSYCSTGDDNSCPSKVLTYAPNFGGYATSFQASSSYYFHLPDEFPGDAAPLFCAGATVYEPLKLYTRPGQKVGIMGIGGLGHLAIQFANKMGLDVTAISTSDSKRDEARELGATGFLNSSNEAEWTASLKKFDHILITASNYSIGKSLDLLRNRGSLALVGLPDRGYDYEMSIGKLTYGNKSIHGGSVASRANIRELIDFSVTHGVKCYSEIYPFAEAQRGFDSLSHGNPHFPRYRAVMETESYLQTFTPAS